MIYMKENLREISTQKLIDELSKRQGINKYEVKEKQNYYILNTDNGNSLNKGSAIILEIILDKIE